MSGCTSMYEAIYSLQWFGTPHDPCISMDEFDVFQRTFCITFLCSSLLTHYFAAIHYVKWTNVKVILWIYIHYFKAIFLLFGLGQAFLSTLPVLFE